jgi:hypothetical protein
MSDILNKHSNELSRFYSYAKDILSNDKIEIPSTLKTKIQTAVIEKLGLDNINQLRDRFEGQAYLNKSMLSLTSIYVLEKSLSKEIKLPSDFPFNSQNRHIVRIDEKSFHLVTSYFGNLPKIEIEPTLPLVFCGIRNDYKNGIFYGFLKNYEIENKELFHHKNTGLISGYEFIGFKHLSAKNIE